MTGHHRRGQDAPGEITVLAEPADTDMTLDELRAFLASADRAARLAGMTPGSLRPRVAVRKSGALKGIWVQVPGGVPGG